MREKLVINKLNLPPKCIELSLKQFRAHYHKRFCNFVTVDIHLEGVLMSFSRARSSRPDVFCKKGILRNFAKLTGKCLCRRLFF